MDNYIIRRAEKRGFFDYGWLKTYHSFSFGEYRDPEFVRFGHLRVLNEDFITPGEGFTFHPHKNMEIITYILEGVLTHNDNLGNQEEIKEGALQIMSAGSGIIHSEWNRGNKTCHLLQVWITPNKKDTEPYYKIYQADHFEKWALIASNIDEYNIENLDNGFKINQVAQIYLLNSGSLKNTQLPETDAKNIWLHIAKGQIDFETINLKAGDAIGFSDGLKKSQTIEFKNQSVLLAFYV